MRSFVNILKHLSGLHNASILELVLFKKVYISTTGSMKANEKLGKFEESLEIHI